MCAKCHSLMSVSPKRALTRGSCCDRLHWKFFPEFPDILTVHQLDRQTPECLGRPWITCKAPPRLQQAAFKGNYLKSGTVRGSAVMDVMFFSEPLTGGFTVNSTITYCNCEPLWKYVWEPKEKKIKLVAKQSTPVIIFGSAGYLTEQKRIQFLCIWCRWCCKSHGPCVTTPWHKNTIPLVVPHVLSGLGNHLHQF